MRSTASNRLGHAAIPTSSAKRRRRAPERLRTRLPPMPCGRGLTDAGRGLADAARCQATFRSAEHLAPDVPRPPSLRASSIARDATWERAASVRSRKLPAARRSRRVRPNVIRADGKTSGLIPRTTLLRVPPYATRQRQSSSERQISRRANPEGSGRYWWRISSGRFGRLPGELSRNADATYFCWLLLPASCRSS